MRTAEILGNVQFGRGVWWTYWDLRPPFLRCVVLRSAAHRQVVLHQTDGRPAALDVGRGGGEEGGESLAGEWFPFETSYGLGLQVDFDTGKPEF